MQQIRMMMQKINLAIQNKRSKKRSFIKTSFALIIFSLGISIHSSAQKIFIDQFRKINDVTLFRTVENENEYYYLPDQISIANDEGGKPQFTFIRYHNFEKKESFEGSSSDQVEGGGLLHTLVEFGIPKAELTQALTVLQKENIDAKILGPVMYESGSVAIVSATGSSAADNEDQYKIHGLGNASIMEGHKSAIAFMLDDTNADLLLNTFDNRTSDLSIVYAMNISGFLSPLKGKISGKYEELYSAHEVGLNVKIPVYGVMVGVDVSAAFEELRKKGIINVSYEGDDEDFQRFIENAYSLLKDVLFEKAPTPNAQKEDTRENLQKSVSKMAAAYASSKNDSNKTSGSAAKESGDSKEKSSFQMTPPEVTVAYKYKSVKQKGTFEFNLNKTSAHTKPVSFTENIGNIKRTCRDCFSEVYFEKNKPKEIMASLDNMNKDDFERYINFISVYLRKKHSQGEESYDEIRIDPISFLQSNNQFKLVYQFKGDESFANFNKYEYKVDWHFYNSYKVEGKWQEAYTNSIVLYPPLNVEKINLNLRENHMQEMNLAAVQANVYYQYGEREIKETVMLEPNALSQQVDIFLPKIDPEFEVEFIGIKTDGTNITIPRKISNSTYLVAHFNNQ